MTSDRILLLNGVLLSGFFLILLWAVNRSDQRRARTRYGGRLPKGARFGEITLPITHRPNQAEFAAAWQELLTMPQCQPTWEGNICDLSNGAMISRRYHNLPEAPLVLGTDCPPIWPTSVG